MLRKRSDHMPQSRVVKLMMGVCEGVKVLHTATPPLAHRYNNNNRLLSFYVFLNTSILPEASVWRLVFLKEIMMEWSLLNFQVGQRFVKRC